VTTALPTILIGCEPTVMCPDGETVSALVSLLEVGRAFFEGPRELRSALSTKPKTMTGWRPIGVEYSQRPDRPDLNETFCFRGADDQPGALGFHPLVDACRTAQRALDVVAAAVLADLAVSVGVPSAQRVRTANESWLQLNWSRPATVDRLFIQDAHEDGHLVTFLFADQPGLEVRGETGWSAVSPTPEALVCFSGECGALLTGDYVTPTMHRVRALPTVDSRLSVAYFVNPDLDQMLPPWRETDRNRDVDLLRWGQLNPARFGLPTL
jgi:isopenicillin N synthase-like dioxygenase